MYFSYADKSAYYPLTPATGSSPYTGTGPLYYSSSANAMSTTGFSITSGLAAATTAMANKPP
jgi:hypothetical protein